MELLFAVALVAVMAGIAVPVSTAAADDLHTAAAARFLAGRVAGGRMEALKRGTSVAIRFDPAGGDYAFTTFLDGNGNGVRTADIRSGADTRLTRPSRLSDGFRGVRVGLRAGLPDADGDLTGSTDGVRIGATRLLTTSPDGTATSGTIYVRGHRAQYAVRILGATGRTRVLKFEPGAGTWRSR